MIKRLLLIGLSFIGIGQSLGQITPPGLDGSKAGGWVAVGFTQAIGTRWAVTTYDGTSTQSSLVGYQFWQMPAISVRNPVKK